jgi:hypothetical protein
MDFANGFRSRQNGISPLPAVQESARSENFIDYQGDMFVLFAILAE